MSELEGRCLQCGCVGPNPGEAIAEENVDAEFALLRPGFWQLSGDKTELTREFTCRNFNAAIEFINRAAEIAERPDINHHPDLHLTVYRVVKIVLKTHSVSALTTADFLLAKGLETIAVEYSPKWMKDHPGSH